MKTYDSIMIDIRKKDNELLAVLDSLVKDIDIKQGFDYLILNLLDKQVGYYSENGCWEPLQKQHGYQQISLISSKIIDEKADEISVSEYLSIHSKSEIQFEQLLKAMIFKAIKLVGETFMLRETDRFLILIPPIPSDFEQMNIQMILKNYPGVYTVRQLGTGMLHNRNSGWSIVGYNEDSSFSLQWASNQNTVQPVFEYKGTHINFEQIEQLEFQVLKPTKKTKRKIEVEVGQSKSNIIPKLLKKELSDDLLTVPPYFYKSSFQIHQSINGVLEDPQIDQVFLDHKKHSIEELVIRIVDETNLAKTALGDVFYIYNYLKNTKYYKESKGLININRESQGLDMRSIEGNFILKNLPANFLDFKWIFIGNEKYVFPDTEQISRLLGEIGQYFPKATTEEIASELCFLLDETNVWSKDPNLLFDAQVFRILENDNRFKKIEVDEIISIPELSSAELKAIKQIDQGTQTNSRSSEERKDLQKGLSLGLLNLSYRSMNCLQRANIITINQLLDLNYIDFLKIRNLKKENRAEILNEIMRMSKNRKYSYFKKSKLYKTMKIYV